MGILHLNLSANRAKQVARLLSSDTARRVMDAVAEESKSETQLAKELNLPLSTVHYNVQKLQEAGLVHSDEYTYSEKGKEVRHYKLASEHVIISTRTASTIPAVIAGTLLTLALALTTFITRTQQAAQSAVLEASPRLMMDSAESAAMMAPPEVAVQPAVWPWVLFGAGAMLLGILVVALVQRYRA